MKLGFVGTGTIASAIVRGLGAEFAAHSTICVSPRSAGISAELARQYTHVSVAASNQAVLDASKVVVLAVRPQIAKQVVGALQFRPDHHVISLIATASLEFLTSFVAPARKITKAVPLPSVALGRGPTAIFPPDPIAAALFDKVGLAIQVDKPEIFDALTAATATMASYFAFADSISSWLMAKGLAAAESRSYVAAIFEGLAITAKESGDLSFPTLATEHATVGGLNEQLMKYLTERGLFGDVSDGLDEILNRISAKPSV